ncbi:putative chloramphenical resistance permease RarD [Citrobacter koseri]|nr:putative chloramphenical resistance permease RarD [Citrobacter koseri]
MDAKQTRQGVLLALAAYFIWGIAPAYFKLIYYVPADEILTHRVIWSFFFMIALMSISRQWSGVKTLLQTPKKIFMLALSAVLIGGNWLLFIWAVNNHHMLEASLGYFINPLVNILLGMLFLGERFRRMQWLAVILAACGVLVQLWTFGSLPIIALGLAFSFAFYGLVRKKIAVEAQTGMLIETLWLLPVAAIYLFGIADSPTSHMGAESAVAESVADCGRYRHHGAAAVLYRGGDAPAPLHAGFFPVHWPNPDVPTGRDVLWRNTGRR